MSSPLCVGLVVPDRGLGSTLRFAGMRPRSADSRRNGAKPFRLPEGGGARSAAVMRPFGGPASASRPRGSAFKSSRGPATGAHALVGVGTGCAQPVTTGSCGAARASCTTRSIRRA
jgi:hypothetical protein